MQETHTTAFLRFSRATLRAAALSNLAPLVWRTLLKLLYTVPVYSLGMWSGSLSRVLSSCAEKNVHTRQET